MHVRKRAKEKCGSISFFVSFLPIFSRERKWKIPEGESTNTKLERKLMMPFRATARCRQLKKKGRQQQKHVPAIKYAVETPNVSKRFCISRGTMQKVWRWR